MPDLVADVDPDRDHLDGPVDAPVTLVEYADFACPSCREARFAIEQAREELGDRLLFVYRHLPVPSAHPTAVPAALVAEAAADQGSFWEMHRRLFDHQDEQGREDLLAHAEALTLDVSAIEEALDEERHADRIEEDVDTALRSGVSGTPGFFIDGRLHAGGWNDGRLLEALREAVGDDEVQR